MNSPTRLITSTWLRMFTILGIPERIGLMVGAALGLSGVYFLYSVLVSPVVKLESIHQMNGSVETIQPPPAKLVNMATRHLPHQPWAAEARYQFRTSDAYVYAGEWEPSDAEKSIRFTPFAMIVTPRDAEPGEDPITITAKTAVVRFDEGFNFPSKPGRIIGGTLQSDVRITGPDHLNITGRNFEFSHSASRIWSDHPLRFAYDGHRGSANGVQLDLVTDPKPDNPDSLAVTGIRKVILRQNVSMDFHVVDEEPDENGELDDPFDVAVTCSDSFEFLVDDHLATFTGNVAVTNPTGDGKADRLRCDQLTIQFRPDPGDEPEPVSVVNAAGAQPPDLDSSRPTTGAAPGSADESASNLAFDRLRAVGRQVVLTSEVNELTAVMSELIYDGPKRVAALLDGEAVKIRHKTTQMQSPEITLLHDEDGTIASAWCRGTGWLKHLDPETQQVQFAAQWARQLRKYREPDTGLDVIEMERQAVVRQPTQMFGLGADFIKLWFQEIEKPESEKKKPEPADTADRGEENPFADSSYLPVRLLALNDVALASPDAHGETSRLEVWFAPPATPEASVAAPQEQNTEVTQTAPPLQGPAAPNATQPPAEPPKRKKAPEQNPFPLEVISDLIQVRIEMAADSEELNVTDIWSEGRVEIRQEHEKGKKPLQVTGSRLRMQNKGEKQEVLHIYGEPAHIREQGMHIEGNEIHLDRDRNLAWVTGAGLLQLPVDKDMEGNALEVPTSLDIWWNDQMTFDGRTARFFGNVRSVLNDNRMRCQEMHVLLTKRLSFSEENQLDDPNRPRDERPIDVYSILCSDGVEFRGYEYEKKRLVGIRHARCAHLAMNQVTGNTEASGPGWMTSWTRGNGSRAGLAPGAEATSNQPRKSREERWEYTKVEFVGKAQGNIRQRTSRFTDQVRIIYGPVDRPLAVIDPETASFDGLPKEGGIMRCSALQVTVHSREGSDKDTVELLADGNAFLEGRNFHAQADTISYDESKELYILRSIEPRKATIWRQETLGSEFSSLEAQRMEFSPKRGKLKLDKTTELQVLQ